MEAAILAALAADETLASEHPNWSAFLVWARSERALYEASRQQWRAQNPLIDVAALEGAYDLTPAALTIRAASGVGEGRGPINAW